MNAAFESGDFGVDRSFANPGGLFIQGEKVRFHSDSNLSAAPMKSYTLESSRRYSMLKQQDVRVSLEQLTADSILPIAKRYGYSPLGLGLQTNWKPIVLIIGNYSSGKSTLINELVGAPVQRTGQAPTDDCFTILTGPDDENAYSRPIEVQEEVPGRTVVNDHSMPFGDFKNFGSRFVSHFLMKRVNSPKLRNLAIIDSPGMLDSVAELDRGYDYQEVIGRFAELADLVVLAFDPHRAGTIKETYVSIRSTLPEATSEDRVVFVMNRIDECKNLIDLVRCYGVLCWNLSQMTGRKDIPRIFLTYSREFAKDGRAFPELADERVELVRKIEQAPRLQVSHLLGTVDNHLHKLELIARTLANATKRYRRGLFSYVQIAMVACLGGAVFLDAFVALLMGFGSKSSIGRLFGGTILDWPILFPVILVALGSTGCYYHYRRRWLPQFHKRLRAEIDACADLDTRYARDLWDGVRSRVLEFLSDPKHFQAFAPHRSMAAKLRGLIENDIKQLYEQHLGTSPRPEPDR